MTGPQFHYNVTGIKLHACSLSDVYCVT